MWLFKTDGTKGGHRCEPAEIRVSVMRKHGSALRIAFGDKVLKAARWKRGDKIIPDFDESTGTFTVSRSTNGRGWSLSAQNGKGSGILAARAELTDAALKVLDKFQLPAAIDDYAEDGGTIVFSMTSR